jgi:hypothetical protein
MSEATKTCNLFQSEIETLIEHHAENISEDISGRLDRINYLHRRLKAFNEPASEVQPAPEAAKGWASN